MKTRIADMPIIGPFCVYDTTVCSTVYSLLDVGHEYGDIPFDIGILPVDELYAVDGVMYITTHT